MTVRTYRGSCHCGVARFEVDMDLGEGMWTDGMIAMIASRAIHD